MPTPNKGEKKQDYMNRCNKELIDKEGYKPDQANAICNSKWDKGKKSENSGNLLFDIFQGSAWAIVPEKLEEINAILLERLFSAQLSDIEAYQAKSGLKSTEHYNIQDGMAFIPVYGVMSKRMNLFSEFSGGTSTQVLRQKIQAAIEDSQVKGIFLDVDSPGGVVEGTKELADYIKSVRDKKPIIAFTDGLMASAAYWVSSAATERFGTDLSQSGSIGVAAVHTDFSKRNEQAGIKKTDIYSGKYKRIASENQALSEEGKSYIQAMVDTYYKIFVNNVADNIGSSVEDTMKMAEGKIFIGESAKQIGLIDHVGTREMAMDRLQNLITVNKKEKRNQSANVDDVENTLTTDGGNKTMDLKELKEKHPDLVKQIQEEATAPINSQIIQINDRLGILEKENKTIKEENTKLKEESVIRAERELQSTIESIWTKKLSVSKIPDRRHDDIKKVVSADMFIKDGILDVEKFGVAIDEKIKDWEGSFTQPVVLGFGSTGKKIDDKDVDLEDQDRAPTSDEQALIDRNLKLVGAIKK